MATRGTVVWPRRGPTIWKFSWRLESLPQEEGIVVEDVYYLNQQVMFKGSLPILRVQYHEEVREEGTVGPYKDQLCLNLAAPTTRFPAEGCGTYELSASDRRGVAVEGYFRIGLYRLLQRWVFWEDGRISPALYSAGRQHDANHTHHAYWRLDFDLSGAGGDSVLEFVAGAPNVGHGPGWHRLDEEVSRAKNHAHRTAWAVVDEQSWRGLQIVPGPNDGRADAFSNADVWFLRYRSAEDRLGLQGYPWADGLSEYLNGEVLQSTDVVVWYCAHLFHNVHPHTDEFHGAGPTLVPFGPWGC